MEADTENDLAPPSIEISDTSAYLFGSPEDHSLWNGLSYLNQELARCIPRQPEESHIYASQSARRRRSRGPGPRERQLNVFSNLLVRKHEVVAVILAGLSAVATGGDKDFKIVVKPKILIAANSRKDDHADSGQEAKTLRVQAFVPARLDAAQGVIAAVLRKYHEYRGSIPFSMHVGWFFGLLSDCHAETLDAAAYRARVGALRRHLSLVSCPAMQARFRIGTSACRANFVSIMTAGISQFPAGSFDLSSPANELSTLPDIHQAAFIRWIFDRVAANDPGIWEGTDADARSRAPLYDLKGRRFFHGMLSVMIQEVCVALDELSSTLERCAKRGWQDPITDELTERVAKEVSRLEKSLMDLNYFLICFAEEPFDSQGRDLLSHYLAWLADCANVKNSTDVPFAVRGASGLQQQPIARFLYTNADRNEESDTDLFSHLVDPRLAAEGEEDVKAISNDWTAAARKYLFLICLHEYSLNQACPATRTPACSRIRSEHIRNADVTFMDISPQDSHGKRRSVEDCLDIVLEMNGINNLDWDQLVNRLLAHRPAPARSEWLKAMQFKGTIHCTAMIMSIMLLASSPDKPTSMTVGEWLEQNSIFGLEDTVLALLKNPSSTLEISKRCCRPCRHMVELMIYTAGIGRGKRLYVSFADHIYHTKLAFMALSPFLPKKFVEDCIDFAKKEALAKLKELQDILMRSTSGTRELHLQA